jgi:hypothetical protein
MTKQAAEAQFHLRQSWLETLEDHKVNFMALDPVHDDNLIEFLKTDPDWVIEFADQDAIFFTRTDILNYN